MKTLFASDCGYDLSISRLKSASIFGALSPEAITFLLEHGALEELDEGEVLFKEDEVADAFYIVLDGSLKLCRGDEKAADVKFGEGSIGFGEEIGYVTMIALHPRAADVIATQTTLVLKINSYVFGQFHDYHSFDFGILILNLSRDMARKLRMVSEALARHHIDVDK
ncbi:cyclic nucleotide-binding domain-containing protein [Marinomonas balearica]|uniref:Cyclic nucleotide-binding protein n=1 Tax=Marinomonas balearica TaxID=491947 RepID=A0A4R6MDR9_9GAMM|nr:cyclic nucleotide-binding domain-containing protein [Marinomonas balearica]TDO99723.1 cyclic nucleotide-binding protein [Marinomonas balearica]